MTSFRVFKCPEIHVPFSNSVMAKFSTASKASLISRGTTSNDPRKKSRDHILRYVKSHELKKSLKKGNSTSIEFALGDLTKSGYRLMPLAHYYDVDRELHELQHRGELVPTRNEIMGKIGASMLLSYSGLVVSYVTREVLGFVRVLHSRVVVSSCSYIREIAKQHDPCSSMKKTPLSHAIALSSY